MVVYSNITMNFARDLLVFKKFELTEVIQKVVIHPYKQILRWSTYTVHYHSFNAFIGISLSIEWWFPMLRELFPLSPFFFTSFGV